MVKGWGFTLYAPSLVTPLTRSWWITTNDQNKGEVETRANHAIYYFFWLQHFAWRVISMVLWFYKCNWQLIIYIGQFTLVYLINLIVLGSAQTTCCWKTKKLSLCLKVIAKRCFAEFHDIWGQTSLFLDNAKIASACPENISYKTNTQISTIK